MPAAFVSATTLKSSSSASVTGSVGTPTAGNALIACGFDYTGSGATMAASDGHNTWTTDISDYQAVTGTTGICSFASTPTATAVATSVTLTISGGSPFTAITGFVYQFSGMANPILDLTGTGGAGTATSGTTPSLTNLNQNDVFLAIGGPTGAPSNPTGQATTGTGWTMPAGGVNTDTSVFIGIGSAYKIVSTIASQAETWTWTDNCDYNLLIIAYKQFTQDTPELRGRPDGLRGQVQMHQLLAQ